MEAEVPPAAERMGELEFVGEPVPHVRRTRVDMYDDPSFRWLRFGRCFFKSSRDATDEEHGWEMVERTTRRGDIDGVDVVAILRRHGLPPAVILVLNYRAPVDAVCLEFPAGLVDAGESAAATALRELKEETGYTGGLVHSVSDMGYIDPYKSTENYKVVFIEVDGDAPENRSPTPERDPEENMQVVIVPVGDMLGTLMLLNRERGCFLEGKVLAFAQGQRFATMATSRPPSSP